VPHNKNEDFFSASILNFVLFIVSYAFVQIFWIGLLWGGGGRIVLRSLKTTENKKLFST
jgi:hypothetical protein